MTTKAKKPRALKAKTSHVTSRVKRPKAFSLKTSTCAQLLEWIESPPAENERKSDVALRRHYYIDQNKRLLALCGPLNASYHKAWCRTARQLEHVPHVRLTCCGGKPKEDSMPPFSASLKRIGLINGQIIHRFGKGAFIQDPIRKDPKTLSHPQDGEAMQDVELFTEAPVGA